MATSTDPKLPEGFTIDNGESTPSNSNDGKPKLPNGYTIKNSDEKNNGAKEGDPLKKKDKKIKEIPSLFEQQKQQVVKKTEQVVLSDNIKVPASIAKAEELLPQQAEMQAQVKKKTEEYLQDLTTLEEEQITFDDII